MSVAGITDRRTLALAGLCGAGCIVLVAALLLDQRALAAGAKLVASSAFVSLAVFAGALVVTILLSLYLARTIAQPVLRLAAAAERVRRGYGPETQQIPDHRRK